MTWVVILAVGLGSFAFRLGPLLLFQRVSLTERGDRLDPPRRHQRHHRADRRLDPAERDRATPSSPTLLAVAVGGRARGPRRLDAPAPRLRRRDLRCRRPSSAGCCRGDRRDDGRRSAMPTIHITLLGRFAVTVDGVPVAGEPLDAPPRRRARQGARPGARPAAAPRADHRSRLARRHASTRRRRSCTRRRTSPGGRSACRTRSCCAATASCCAPTPTSTVDVVQFEELARRALADEDVAAAREALALYGGELLPAGPLRGVGRGAARAAPPPPPRPAAPRRPVGGGGRARPERRARPPRADAPPRRQRRSPRRAAPVRAHGPHAAPRARRRARAARRWRCATASSPSTTSPSDRPRRRARSAATAELSVAEQALARRAPPAAAAR